MRKSWITLSKRVGIGVIDGGKAAINNPNPLLGERL